MTQEEKAKAYDEALKRAKNLENTTTEEETVIRYIFPEFVEDEDEKIRKSLLAYIKGESKRLYTKEWIAYLEKQKEQESLNISAASEWLRKRVHLYMNSEYNEFHKCVEYVGSIDKERLINDFEEAMRKEQKPVEPIEFNNEFENQVSHLLASVLNGEHEYNEGFVKHAAQSLLGYAKKEQKDYKKLYEDIAKSEWFKKNYVGKSLGENPYDFAISQQEKQKEQKKPTLDDPDIYGDWDNDLMEEIHSWLGHLDGKYTPYTIDDIKLTARHFVEWQKQKEQKPAECIPDTSNFDEGFKTGREVGFREGVESVKPVEWSEKDEEMRNLIVAIFEVNHPDGFFKANELGTTDMRGVYTEEIISWLKSRSPYLHWKPSKREMDAFETALKGEFQNGVYPAATLCGLFGELKKLYYNDEIPPHWKPSEEQMASLRNVAYGSYTNGDGANLRSLYEQLKELM